MTNSNLQTSTSAHADAVAQREQQHRQALLAGDVATLRDMCEDALFYRHASCKLDDKRSFLESLERTIYHSIDVTSQNVIVSGGTAIVSLVEKIVVRLKDTQADRVSHVLAIDVWSCGADASWRLLARQANYDPTFPR